jgi:serine/threonine-protein kinase 24/25/MST4
VNGAVLAAACRQRAGGELTGQRPTARDLLKHKFIKTAKKASYLTELIERHQQWKAEGGAPQKPEEAQMSYEYVQDSLGTLGQCPAAGGLPPPSVGGVC